VKEIVDWLIHIEQLAGTFYSEVSEGFRGDKEIADFFLHLSEEEAFHLHVMKSASAYLRSTADRPSFMMLDDSTKEKIESPFVVNRGILSSGRLDREKLMSCLVTTEFSEWNDIFLYIVKTLKEESREYMEAASKMQWHLQEIGKFLETTPEGQKHLYVLKCLPPIWREKILIVEEDEAVVGFLDAVLQHEGMVTETATGSEEGLRKIRDSHFDVIVLDIDTPVTGEIDFYRRATADHPGIGERFLFIVGTQAQENISFFQQQNLRFIQKPAPIHAIKQQVDEILHRGK
jgi:CheY-like chemotaxis protein